MKWYYCPQCGSHDTRPIPLVYKTGHSTGSETHTELIGYDDCYENGEWVSSTPVYGDVTRPTYMLTDLARELLPPQEPTKLDYEKIKGDYDLWAILFGAFMACVVNNSIFGIVAGVAGAMLGRIYAKQKDEKAIERNNAIDADYQKEVMQYRRELHDWQNSYICMRCGTKFVCGD